MNNKEKYDVDYETSGFISKHYIHNGNLILLLDVYLDDYNEHTLMEKSIFLGGKDYFNLLTELRLDEINQYDDLDQLDGIGVIAEIIRLDSGIHAIGEITLDEEYWEYCRECYACDDCDYCDGNCDDCEDCYEYEGHTMERFLQYMKEMEGNANE